MCYIRCYKTFEFLAFLSKILLKDREISPTNQGTYNICRKSGSEANVTNKDDLIKKLNYMIHLLEEQHDEKTSNVTEELVLYLFLGVFVIFVVDSFARAGKYTR